jgi:hypothetical protein
MPLAAVDAAVIGVEVLVPLDRHAPDGQLVNGLVDVVHGEVEDGERPWRVVGLGIDQDALVTGEAEHEGTALLGHPQAQRLAVERHCRGKVIHGEAPEGLRCSKHDRLRFVVALQGEPSDPPLLGGSDPPRVASVLCDPGDRPPARICSREVGPRGNGWGSCSHKEGAMSGKPGRPPEDRLRRQHEIYLAVAPLIERLGAKRLTMRQAARAAHLSLGGLYHYFPTKRDLVLHALKPEAVARLCAEFHGRHADLARTDPGRYVQADVAYMARQCFFLRPAFQAALELDAEVA